MCSSDLRVRMKTCLARERGTGGRSEGEDERRWTFVNEERRINNALESDRSRLLSGVVEKSCSSTKEISKTWMAYPTPSTENNTGYLPMSKHQTRSKARYDPSRCPQTAAPSTSLRPFEQPHSHRPERAKPCQEGTVIRERSKTNVRSKLRPDGAVIQASSRPLERPCSSRSERKKPCQDGTVNRERSKANVGPEKKLKTSSVKYLDRGAIELDLPGPSMNEPSSPAGQPTRLDGTTNSKRSRTNVNEMEHNVSFDSPRDRGESQLRLPKWEVPQNRHASQRCMSSWRMPRPKVEVEIESIDARQ